MKVLQAVIMGVLQGITEFLPVSSSGHLALIKGLFGYESDTGVLFDVLLHFATILSICAVFFKDIIRIATEFGGLCADVFSNFLAFSRSITDNNPPRYRKIMKSPYRKFVVLIIVTTIPTGILGFLLRRVVEFTSSNLMIVGICLIGTGLCLFLSDYLDISDKKLNEANYGDAFCLGVVQGASTLPGLSRSGTTITAALLCGFDRKFAAKYSFIMSIPAVLGALILELTQIGNETITGGDVGCFILGMFIATVIGFFALKITMKMVVSKYFKYFSFYCFAIGVISIIVYFVK